MDLDFLFRHTRQYRNTDHSTSRIHFDNHRLAHRQRVYSFGSLYRMGCTQHTVPTPIKHLMIFRPVVT